MKQGKIQKNRISIVAICFIAIIVFGIFIMKYRDSKSENKYDENSVGEIYFHKTQEENIVINENGIMYANNEILLVSSELSVYEDIEQLAKEYGAEIVGWIEKTGDYQLKLSKTHTEEELIAIVELLNKDSHVDSASLDYIFQVSNEGIARDTEFLYGEKWEKDLQEYDNCKGKSWGIEAINAITAWEILKNHAEKVNPVRVGLIDNGFDVEHSDLGFAETFYNSNIEDHGTHVAGTMAAKTNNNEGICGVYPFGDGNLYGVSYEGIIEYSENENIFSSSMFLKISYAELILRNVKVINSSLGFNHYKWIENTEHWNERVKFLESNAYILADFLDRLLDKGFDFVIVSAAGNDSDRIIGITYDCKYSFWPNLISEEYYPDVYNRIIVVGAVDSKFKICNFSNGGERIDVYAPGKDIYSTVSYDKYKKEKGTSMAAPHVSGVAAMVWSLNNDLSGSQVKEIICKYGNERCTSGKMVDAYAALEATLNYDAEDVKAQDEKGGILCWVVDESDESIKIKNALITVTNVKTGESESVVTDENGHFELILSKGEYTLSVLAKGYDKYIWREENNGLICVENGQVNYLSDWIKIKKIKIEGYYTIDVEKTNASNDSSLVQYFGSSINYGYEMILNEDGTVSWYIGTGNGGIGNYVFQDKDGQIEYIDYEEGGKRIVPLILENQSDKRYIVMEYEDYQIYWLYDEQAAIKRILLEETGMIPIASYYEVFEKNSDKGMIAIYQYDSEWEDEGNAQNCQVWYSDGISARQLFKWENAYGPNAYCYVEESFVYESSEGIPYIVLNTRERVSLS